MIASTYFVMDGFENEQTEKIRTSTFSDGRRAERAALVMLGLLDLWVLKRVGGVSRMSRMS